MIPVEIILLFGSTLLILSVLASKATGRFGVPALLVFIGVGMLAGSEGPGGIFFENYFIAQALGVFALAVILFSGGLQTRWREIRPVLWQGLSLSTLCVLITAGLVGWAARALLGFNWLQGLLLGAIISSTDAAAVFSILRARSVALRGNTQALLEFESGSNDPMAVFLTLALIGLIGEPGRSPWSVLPMFLQQMALGGAFGYAGGKLLVVLLNRIKLEHDGLYPVLILSSSAFIYSVTATLGGSGFVAVYLAGLILGNSEFLHKRSLTRFLEGLGWMMQIVMFLALGLLVYPSSLARVAGPASLIALLLIFAARPISVFISLAAARLSWREKTMIAWVGLRGAAPIILATFPPLAGVPGAKLIFDTVFFAVLFSVLLQGTSLPWVAKLLGLDSGAPAPRKSLIEFSDELESETGIVEVVVPADAPAIGRRIVELGLPPNTLIVLITRGSTYFVPRGDTVVQPHDSLLVLADKETLVQARRNLMG